MVLTVILNKLDYFVKYFINWNSAVFNNPGLALTYILENSFKVESGSRPGVPKIGILITDGKSQDDVIPPAQNLKDAGIELFAIGMSYMC